MKTRNMILLLFCAFLTFTSCKDNGNEAENTEMQRQTELEAEQQQESDANNIDTKLSTIDSLSQLQGLVETAQVNELLRVGEGPFTFFAPTNSAIDKMDKATLDTLMQIQHREELENLLQYHIIQDGLSVEELMEEIKENDGQYTLSSMDELGEVTATLEDGQVILIDEKGNKARIMGSGIEASNGVIYLIDGVLQFKGEETDL